MGKNAVYPPKRPIYGKTTAFDFKLQDPMDFRGAEMNVSYVPSEPGEAVLTEGDTLSAQDASDGNWKWFMWCH